MNAAQHTADAVETSEVLSLLVDGPKSCAEIYALSSAPRGALSREIGRLVLSGAVTKEGATLRARQAPAPARAPVEAAPGADDMMEAVLRFARGRQPVTLTDGYCWENQ